MVSSGYECDLSLASPWKRLIYVTVVLINILSTCVCRVIVTDDPVGDLDPEKYYTNGWAIQLTGDDTLARAKRIAEKHGFDRVTKIGSLEGYYHLEHPHHAPRSKRSFETKTEVLRKEEQVVWVEQQHEYLRNKRGAHHQHVVTRGIEPRFADPLWDEQWYLDDKRSQMDLDVNVIPVWKSGISGKGVVVTILDDGIEHNHTDLARNYDPAASWDVNDNDPDPFPRYDPTNENKHGTRCAGEVAAQANNTKCGVGVAYNARIGGVRMLDGRVTDRVEAESLSLNPQYIDIYSASWGPSDDGMTVEGPGTLASAAFLNGITKGRGGLGSIYVWASGNGGRHDDSCNCDGYTASIYTLSISSSSDHGESPWYSEACASTLATTLSSGAHGEKRIVTTDLHNQCTERHTGTSASAPLAGGIIALALERNPKLNWRDVQHLVVHTANWLPLRRDNDWRMNGVGMHVNEKFGFGLLDSERLVKMANPLTFRSVQEKRECRGNTFSDARSIRWDQPLILEIESDGCQHTKEEIRYLEHVQLVLTIDYTRRGDLTLTLTSPMGTRSVLLPVRSEDASDEGFKRWAFMSTHMWGEDPRGKWTLEVKDGGESRTNTGTLREWQLILHGTKEKPHHQNVTHLEVPLHRKAVPDDMKNAGKSSVQITQITYTFGDQGAPPQTIIAPNDAPFSQLFPSPPILPSQHPTNPFSAPQPPRVFAQPPPPPQPQQQQRPPLEPQQTALSEYNYNMNSPYAYARSNGYTNQDAYGNSQSYGNAASGLASLLNQQTLAQISNNMNQQPQQIVQPYQTAVNQYPPSMIGRSLGGWGQQTDLSQIYSDPNANLWDFFGRMNVKRNVYIDDRTQKPTNLIEALENMSDD